ncbi:hypothetical protein ACFL1B_02545 [Nanoarchaeota archaeon]
MMLIAHRINKISELKKLPADMAVEIDIRAMGDRLILNHEPHGDGDDLEEYLKFCSNRFIIFNIKEDGIEDKVVALADKYGVPDFFLLDVEYPYIYRATRQGFRKIALRYSEAEPIEFALDHAGQVDWVWVDTNTMLPLDKDSYNQLKNAGFKLCLVCPERWGRPEDIKAYRAAMKKDGIEVDAVMTAVKYMPAWS